MSQVDRYALFEAIAKGGMGTVHLGRLAGSAGFTRTVAIKRLHEHLVADASVAETFATEARLAARVRHPNVVPVLDVVASETAGVLLVMEYVDGESLSALVRVSVDPIPLPIIVAIVSEMLHGLHAAHEARSEAGEPLEIVHRDVSPQNVLVGADGVARLVDFGIARANNQASVTDENDLKGKLAYMAPEQIRRERVTRRVDVFAAGIVLWELLTGQRLFASEHPGSTIEKILVGWVAPPSSVARDLPPAFDAIALRALDADPSNRFATAREMAMALEDALPRALGRDVGAWVEKRGRTSLAYRRAIVARVENGRGAAEGVTAPTAPEVAHGNEDETGTEVLADERSAHGVVLVPEPPRTTPRVLPLALVGLAAAVTVLLGGARPRAMAAAPGEPPVLASISPPPGVVLVVPPPIAAPTASVAPTRAPVVRRVAPSAPRARRTPCLAKVDPVTQKKVYQGDCD